tara:strand:+ start:824 stop:1498 length:675 start_codon:yes stop_codon:yes gene_type:complete
MTKGIWLSIELLHDKNTTMQEKLLLVEINQLSMLDKGCIASNNHFAETFKVKKESISRSLSSLEKKDYISSVIKNGSRNHSRVITINKMLFEYEQNVIEPLTNCLETKENKTTNKTMNSKPTHKSNNDKLYNEYLASKETTKNEESLILDYLVYRKDIKKIVTTIRPLNTYYKVIVDLHTKGYDIKQCIDLMKNKEWMSLSEEWIKNSGLKSENKTTSAHDEYK